MVWVGVVFFVMRSLRGYPVQIFVPFAIFVVSIPLTSAQSPSISSSDLSRSGGPDASAAVW